jgi:hypothetical protein
MSKKDKGLFIGESHDNGGIPSMVKETGQLIEIEGDEYYICRDAYHSDDVYEFKGKTNKEVLDKFYTDHSCKLNQSVMSAGDFIVCKIVVKDKTKHDRGGTIKEILNQMQHEKSCKVEDASAIAAKGGGITDEQLSLFVYHRDNNTKAWQVNKKKWLKYLSDKGIKLPPKKKPLLRRKKIRAGYYEVYNRETNKLLGYVEEHEETGLWSAIDLDQQAFETGDTLSEVITAFEVTMKNGGGVGEVNYLKGKKTKIQKILLGGDYEDNPFELKIFKDGDLYDIAEAKYYTGDYIDLDRLNKQIAEEVADGAEGIELKYPTFEGRDFDEFFIWSKSGKKDYMYSQGGSVSGYFKGKLSFLNW